MKFKLLSIVVAITFILFGCATGNDNQEGAMDGNNNPNIEQTRYNDNDRTNERFGANDDTRGNGTDGLLNNERDNDRNNLVDDNRNNDQRFDISQRAADRITDEIDEINYAYVLTTDNNAYVAATVDRDNQNNNNNTNNNNMNNNGNGDQEDEITDEVKDKIANIVQSVDNDIDNVYVSTNPDFVNMVNDYADDVNNDRPIRGMFDELGDMIERIFPQNQR